MALSSCDSDSEYAAEKVEPGTDFEKACKAFGGSVTGDANNQSCVCLGVTCDPGEVCNSITKACPQKDIVSVACDAKLDSKICVNGERYECKVNRWEPIRVCDYGCVSLTSDCADCDKDQCKDGVLRKCNNSMLEAEGNACPTNQCADETKCSVECNAGDTRSSNGYIQVCNNNIFENSKACKNGCDAQNISCATTCTEGSTICIDGVLKKMY